MTIIRPILASPVWFDLYRALSTSSNRVQNAAAAVDAAAEFVVVRVRPLFAVSPPPPDPDGGEAQAEREGGLVGQLVASSASLHDGAYDPPTPASCPGRTAAAQADSPPCQCPRRTGEPVGTLSCSRSRRFSTSLDDQL